MMRFAHNINNVKAKRMIMKAFFFIPLYQLEVFFVTH